MKRNKMYVVRYTSITVKVYVQYEMCDNFILAQLLNLHVMVSYLVWKVGDSAMLVVLQWSQLLHYVIEVVSSSFKHLWAVLSCLPQVTSQCTNSTD